MVNIVKKTGWVNIHMETSTKHLIVSNKPYPSKKDADEAWIWGSGIQKVGTFEIEWEEYNVIDNKQTGEV